MIVAREKKKKNIAEYVLYMWQLEDLIRAYNFDIQALEKEVFEVFSGDESLRQEFYTWYGDLIQMMEMENRMQENEALPYFHKASGLQLFFYHKYSHQ